MEFDKCMLPRIGEEFIGKILLIDDQVALIDYRNTNNFNGIVRFLLSIEAIVNNNFIELNVNDFVHVKIMGSLNNYKKKVTVEDKRMINLYNYQTNFKTFAANKHNHIYNNKSYNYDNNSLYDFNKVYNANDSDYNHNNYEYNNYEYNNYEHNNYNYNDDNIEYNVNNKNSLKQKEINEIYSICNNNFYKSKCENVYRVKFLSKVNINNDTYYNQYTNITKKSLVSKKNLNKKVKTEQNIEQKENLIDMAD